MAEFSFYEAQKNTDQTEGRGPMRTFARYVNEDDALEAVKGHGVMFVGDGEVVHVTYTVDGGEVIRTSRKVYGYRQGWDGKWGVGFVDNRDAPVNDPEYKEWLRLNAKFGGR